MCLTVSVAPFSLRFLSDDKGVRKLWQGPVEAEPERLTQPPPQLGEALPPGRRRHASAILPRMRRHPEVSEAVHKLRGGVDLLRHDVCPDQSEACIGVTWSVLTNQRPVGGAVFWFLLQNIWLTSHSYMQQDQRSKTSLITKTHANFSVSLFQHFITIRLGLEIVFSLLYISTINILW